jgi:hypothetical protein
MSQLCLSDLFHYFKRLTKTPKHSNVNHITDKLPKWNLEF